MPELSIVVEDQESRKKRKIRITKWAMFTVVFGIAPLFASWVVSDDSFSMFTLVGHGELFLIAAVLTGDAFGRVFNERATQDVLATICLGALGLILAYSALEFGYASKDLVQLKHITTNHVYVSVADFVAAFAAAFAAVRMEE